MTAPDCPLEPVETLSADAVAQVRRIYEDGFPPRLRASFPSVTHRREPGELALALVDAGRPAGFAVLRPLGGTGWMFLRYFVVDGSLRGQGVGGILWDRLTARLRDDGFTLLVFDVEDPAEPGCPPAEAQLRSRRISFYERHGARILPVGNYQAPHPADETPGWSRMLLMAASLTAGGAKPGDDPAQAIVTAVYRYRWMLAPDDPRIAAAEAAPAVGHRDGRI